YLYAFFIQMAAQDQLRAAPGLSLAEVDAFLQGQLFSSRGAQAPAAALGQAQQYAAAAEETRADAGMQMEADGVGQSGRSLCRIGDLDPVFTAEIVAAGAQVEPAVMDRAIRQTVAVVLHFQKCRAFHLFPSALHHVRTMQKAGAQE